MVSALRDRVAVISPLGERQLSGNSMAVPQVEGRSGLNGTSTIIHVMVAQCPLFEYEMGSQLDAQLSPY